MAAGAKIDLILDMNLLAEDSEFYDYVKMKNKAIAATQIQMMNRLTNDLKGTPMKCNKDDICQRCWKAWGLVTAGDDSGEDELYDDSYV
jgi:hypothetical protein